MAEKSERAGTARPFSIRLTDGERAALQAKAGRVPLGAYARTVLLGGHAARRDASGPAPRVDSALLARMLALLGASDFAGNLGTLARHADAGTLTDDPDTLARLRDACDALTTMRLLLLHALGKRILHDAKESQPATPEEWL